MPEELPFRANDICYAGYPSAALHENRGQPKQIRQLLWGDWCKVSEDESGDDGWIKIRARGNDGWVKREQLQREKLLEIVFVDIGQGDGALLVTPDDRF